VEVLRHLPRLLRLRRELHRRTAALQPAAFVGIDAPDFNLGLEEKLRAGGVHTVHFISPSIWAWRRERLAQIARAVDRMLLVFPFEQQIYDEAGIRASYVGHPLASMIPLVPDAAARRRLGFEEEWPRCRLAHVRRNYPARPSWPRWRNSLAGGRIAFVLRSRIPDRGEIEAMLADTQDSGRVTLTTGRSHDCPESSDVVLASGNAMEAALFKRLMVISYRMPWLGADHAAQGLHPYAGLPTSSPESSCPSCAGSRDTHRTRHAVAVPDDALRDRTVARFNEMHAALKRDTARPRPTRSEVPQ
jgi:lipid-A-disaccharide synthase